MWNHYRPFLIAYSIEVDLAIARREIAQNNIRQLSMYLLFTTLFPQLFFCYCNVCNDLISRVHSNSSVTKNKLNYHFQK